MTFKKTLMGTFIVLFFLHFNLSLSGAPRRPVTNQVLELSAEEAQEKWVNFVLARQADTFFFTFELKHYPRRDKESSYFGNMLAMRIGDKYHTRLSFKAPDGKDYDYLFIQDELSIDSKVYSYNFEKQCVELIEASAYTAPLAEGLIYTPFDLLMTYKYWDFEYLKAGRITQAVYFFKLKSPFDWAGDIEIALTREFNSPLETKFFAKDGSLLRTFTLGSVKKIDNYWIVKSAEIKDEASKDKDKLIIQGASLSISDERFNESLFNKDNLGKEIPRILLNEL